MRRVFWTAFVGMFLLCGAWATAAPYDGTPDEQQHIYRAAGIMGGQLAPPPKAAIDGTGGFTQVPASLVRTNCWNLRSESAACMPDIGGSDTGPTWVATRAARYHPGYYIAVGWPLAIWPHWAGLILARLLNAAIMAGFVAAAFALAWRWTAHHLGVAAVIVAATPMVASFGGTINPTGPEIAAGTALFAAIIPLLLGKVSGADARPLVHVAGVAAVALASLRALGPFWLAVSVLVLLLPLTRARLRELWQLRALRWWIAGTVVAAALHAVWMVRQKTTELGAVGAGVDVDLVTGIRFETEQRWDRLFVEMVGMIGWMEQRLPVLVYLAWFMVLGYLLFAGFVAAGRADRVRMVLLFVITAGVTAALAAHQAPKLGFITQGRYMMPVLVGLPLLAAHLIGRDDPPWERVRATVRTVATLLLPVHLLAVATNMARWQAGPESPVHLNPFIAGWTPPLTSYTPVVLAIAGVAALMVLAWRTHREHPTGVPVAAGQ